MWTMLIQGLALSMAWEMDGSFAVKLSFGLSTPVGRDGDTKS